MPKLPTFDAPIDLGTTAQVRGGGKVPSVGPAITNLGRSISKATNRLNAKRESDADLERRRVAAEARTQWVQRIQDLKDTAREGAFGFTDDLLAEYEEYRQEVIGSAPTNQSRKALEVDLESLKTGLAQDAVQFESIERTKFKAQSAQQIIDDDVNSVLAAPGLLENALSRQEEFMASLTNVSDLNKQKIFTDTNSRLHLAAARGELLELERSGTYEDVLEFRDEFKSSKLFQKGLSAEDFEAMQTDIIKLSTRALAKENGEQTDIENKLKEFEKQEQEETFKSAIELDLKDKLTPQWVIENREDIPAKDFEHLMKIATGELTQRSDVLIYGDLRFRASFGEDTRAEAKQALVNNDITISDFNNILNEVEQGASSGRAQKLPRWYGAGKRFINVALNSELNINPAAKRLQAEALDDFLAWTLAHQDATAKEARDFYKGIVDNAELIAVGELTIGIIAPDFLEGGRESPDIIATVKRTQKAFEDGELDEQEFLRQVRLIQAWRGALKAMGKRRAADSGKVTD